MIKKDMNKMEKRQKKPKRTHLRKKIKNKKNIWKWKFHKKLFAKLRSKPSCFNPLLDSLRLPSHFPLLKSATCEASLELLRTGYYSLPKSFFFHRIQLFFVFYFLIFVNSNHGTLDPIFLGIQDED